MLLNVSESSEENVSIYVRQYVSDTIFLSF